MFFNFLPDLTGRAQQGTPHKVRQAAEAATAASGRAGN
jgi:hypothetical protein